MNQYEKTIQLLKDGCRTLEHQCSAQDEIIQKQNLLLREQEDMIQILKNKNKYLQERVETLTKAYQVQEELCQTQEALIRQMMEQIR